MTATEDDFVMATNNSSIVSKRSVERLYHDEPHFIRHFVRKPMRRSPVIHRGYWLRMKAISEVVRIFLEESSDRPKVVLNLGCGADPLPFQWLAKEPELCKNVKFIDIDHPKLIAAKTELVLNTTLLRATLRGEEQHASLPHVPIDGQSYAAIGCDLRDLTSLDTAVKFILRDTDPVVLCLAEVSIAYMPAQEADALIRWASTLANDVTFGLLEQFLPDGPHHPFAKTMLQHFVKLKSPLKSIDSYVSLASQCHRFKKLGWSNVVITSLWNLWSNAYFISSRAKEQLDEVEPFDEWEEFSLFASHYFLLVASTRPLTPRTLELGATDSPADLASIAPGPQIFSHFHLNPKLKGRRRHGALLRRNDHTASLHGGMGSQSRLGSCDVYAAPNSSAASAPGPPAPPRQCHTITAISQGQALLVGGRSSPNAAMSDCWLWKDDVWRRVTNLPEPRFRHAASSVAHASHTGVIVFGGKADQRTVLGDWLLWEEEQGWRKLKALSRMPDPRFGSTIVSLGRGGGLLFGGMNGQGIILQDVWVWYVFPDTCAIELFCISETSSGRPPGFARLCRFGATVHITNGRLAIIGGLGLDGCLPQNEELTFFDIKWDGKLPLVHHSIAPLLDWRSDVSRPLLVGHCSFVGASNEIVIIGGGAVCFSFGTFLNDGVWAFSESLLEPEKIWTLKEHDETYDYKSNVLSQSSSGSAQVSDLTSLISSCSLRANSKDFEQIVKAAAPIAAREVDLGRCTEQWSSAYLREAVGADRQVIVHLPHNTNMNFQKKNFDYITLSFGEFLSRIDTGEKLYLRSISSDKPSQTPSNFSRDFPGLANDFLLPPSLDFAKANTHSSVLRISNTKMWLHYDTRANIYCLIRGSRKMILYPPSDVTHLSFPPGASTSQLDIFSDDGGPSTSPRLVPNTHPHEVTLHPGDVLFIPPLWLHAGAASSDEGGVSVAVNVFFNSFDRGYAAGRDVYGNRDLQPYETGRRSLDKIVKGFEGLPRDVARAYIGRLAAELVERSESLV